MQRLTSENKKLKVLKSINLRVIPKNNFEQLDKLFNDSNYEKFENYFYNELKQFTNLLKYFEKNHDEKLLPLNKLHNIYKKFLTTLYVHSGFSKESEQKFIMLWASFLTCNPNLVSISKNYGFHFLFTPMK